MATTIKNVAKEAGLSVGTVSRYLNGEKLKIENQEAIEGAIAKLGFEANTIARSMKTGKTMTIAVIVPHLANMFSMRVIESIERELQKNDYCVIISDCGDDPKKEIERLMFLKNRMVDGFVLMPSGYEAEVVNKVVGSIPLVLIDRTLDKPIFDSIIIDNDKMSYTNVCKLLDSGIKKIGIIEGPQNVFTARQRRIGYENALKKYGITKEFFVKCKAYTFAEGFRAMKELQQYDLEAVFVSNYELSVGAINANDNEQLKILGFDTLEIPTRFYQNYTGIQQPIERIGELAARILLERIRNPKMDIVTQMIDE